MNLSKLSPNEFLDKLNNLFKLYTESNSASFNDTFIESCDDSTESKIKYLTATEFLERVQNIVNMYMSESMGPLKKMTMEEFKKAVNEDEAFPKQCGFYKWFQTGDMHNGLSFKTDYKFKVIISALSKLPDTDRKPVSAASNRTKSEFISTVEYYIKSNAMDSKYLGGLFELAKLAVTKPHIQEMYDVLEEDDSEFLTKAVVRLHKAIKSQK